MTGLVEPVAWMHPTAKWPCSSFNVVMNHCRVDGADGGPVPLVLLSQLQAAEVEIERQQGIVSSSEAERYRSCSELLIRAEAAEAEVSKLKAQVETARVALKPFSNFAEALADLVPDEISIGIFAGGAMRFGPSGGASVGDMRTASAALRALSDEVNDGQ